MLEGMPEWVPDGTLVEDETLDEGETLDEDETLAEDGTLGEVLTAVSDGECSGVVLLRRGISVRPMAASIITRAA